MPTISQRSERTARAVQVAIAESTRYWDAVFGALDIDPEAVARAERALADYQRRTYGRPQRER